MHVIYIEGFCWYFTVQKVLLLTYHSTSLKSTCECNLIFKMQSWLIFLGVYFICPLIAAIRNHDRTIFWHFALWILWRNACVFAIGPAYIVWVFAGIAWPPLVGVNSYTTGTFYFRSAWWRCCKSWIIFCNGKLFSFFRIFHLTLVVKLEQSYFYS